MTASKAVRKLLGHPMQLLAVGSIDRFLPVRMCGVTAVTGTIIREWTTSLDTSSRTFFVREEGREGGCQSGCPRHVERRVT